MSYLVFILIYFFSLGYILLVKRTVDYYTVLFGGLFYYALPLVIGKISLLGVVVGQDINDLVFWAYSIAFIISLFFMFKSDHDFHKSRYNHKFKGNLDKLTAKRINLLTVFISLLFIIGVYQLGLANYLSTNKAVNEESITLIQISIVLSMIMMPVSLYYRKFFLFAAYFLILFSFLLYGARSYFVVALLSSAFIWFRFRELRLISKIPVILLGILFTFGMAVYKLIYNQFRSLSFSQLVETVRSLDRDLIIAHLLGDPMAVVYNLNYSINNNISLSFDYLFHRLFSIIPGGGSIFSKLMGESYPRYAYILNEIEYTQIHWGLASSIFAELISISGFLGFIVIFFLASRMLFVFNNDIKLKGLNFFNLIFISAVTYALFYSHRLDITFVLGVFKFCILIWLLFKFILPITSTSSS